MQFSLALEADVAPLSRLTLHSDLNELARVSAWAEELAAFHALPAKTSYAVNLCLEEALSNVIRHGYRGEAGHSLSLAYAVQDGRLTLTIEDQAAAFNPLELPEPAAAPMLEDLIPGGQGIHLIRRFASHVMWEPLSPGNRLKIVFDLPNQDSRTK